jgi:hypothetical protein
MIAFFEKKNLPFVFLFVIVFISRLPFLSAGYGVEEDSWGIALAAFHTKCTGIYEPSRLPGHPFQEFIFSTLWGAGPILFNASCAFFSTISAVFFALILKHLKFKQFFLAAIAFAFVPVYYISSTYTIDFAWTEAFILMAFYFLLKNKYILCGVLIGLAIGCRVTSGVMLIPFMIIIWQDDFKLNMQRLWKMLIPMTVVSIALFIPIIRQFGFSFFMYYDQFPYPPFTKVMYKMIIGVFGFIGTLSLIVFLFNALFNKKNQWPGEGFDYSLDKKIILASTIIIGLYIISYFRLPQKSGYMIPVLPFVILLFGYYLNRKNFRWLCWSFIISSFLFGINLTDVYRGADYSKYAVVFKISGQEIYIDPLTGPVFSDYSKRLQKEAFTNEVIRKSSGISSKTVIIAGWWYNEIMVTMIGRVPNDFVIYEPYINEATMKDYRKKNYQIYYLPEQNKYNDLMYKIEVTDQFAKSFIE